MIPALICPVLNRPDLLLKMLGSIDDTVERTIIIDNGGVVPPDIEAIRLPRNLGVAASWNLGIQASIDAAWWFIVNFDITFAPGDLAAIAAEVKPKESGIWLARDWAAFAITPSALSLVGFFDTGFINGYCEDNDFARRAYLAGVPMHRLTTGIEHVGSATIHSDERLMSQNHMSFKANVAYYEAKWGGPMHGGEEYDTPFGEDGSLRDIRTDIERLRRYSWTKR